MTSEAIAHRFSAPFRVRFDKSGPDGRLRTSALLRYAQDLAWQHSDDRGFDRAWYAGRAMTWLVRAAEVAVLAPVVTGQVLTGTTTVVGWRRVWSRRRTDFHDETGALAAWVHIDWVLIDGRGAPFVIPPEFQAGFGVPGATFPLARVSLDEPPSDAATTTLVVRPQELDPMDHVNNAVYADWLEEAVLAATAGDTHPAPTRTLPRLARLEYARSAEPAAVVTLTTWRDPGGWSCRIADAAGADLVRARLEPGPSAVASGDMG